MPEKVRIVCALTDPEDCPHLLVAKYFDCCTGCEHALEKAEIKLADLKYRVLHGTISDRSAAILSRLFTTEDFTA